MSPRQASVSQCQKGAHTPPRALYELDRHSGLFAPAASPRKDPSAVGLEGRAHLPLLFGSLIQHFSIFNTGMSPGPHSARYQVDLCSCSGAPAASPQHEPSGVGGARGQANLSPTQKTSSQFSKKVHSRGHAARALPAGQAPRVGRTCSFSSHGSNGGGGWKGAQTFRCSWAH